MADSTKQRIETSHDDYSKKKLKKPWQYYSIEKLNLVLSSAHAGLGVTH